jgi:DNA-binding response OmpR family regulator
MEQIRIGNGMLAQSVPYFPRSKQELSNCTAWLDDKEWRFFDALWQCKDTLVTRRYLFLCVYPDPRSRPASIRSVDVLACRVRKKLAILFNGKNCIRQIYGWGYLFCIPE